MHMMPGSLEGEIESFKVLFVWFFLYCCIVCTLRHRHLVICWLVHPSILTAVVGEIGNRQHRGNTCPDSIFFFL